MLSVARKKKKKKNQRMHKMLYKSGEWYMNKPFSKTHQNIDRNKTVKFSGSAVEVEIFIKIYV